MSTKRKILVTVLVLLIVLTLVFIFSRSAKSEAASSNESANVVGVVKPIVDPENKIPEPTFTHYMRKTAHFLEFALLGFECILFIIVLTGKTGIKDCLLSLSFCLVSALTDESIQILSKRGSLVSDVWIDLSGAFLASAAVIVIFTVLKSVKSRKKNS